MEVGIWEFGVGEAIMIFHLPIAVVSGAGILLKLLSISIFFW